MLDERALDGELKELVAWSDYHALRGRREQEAAPHIRKIAEKFGLPETLVWARFWLFVGVYGRTTRIGEQPTVEDGQLKKGKYGSRKLLTKKERA